MAEQTKHSRSESDAKFEVRCWLPWLVIGSVWLWFCGPMMCGLTVVGFRDSVNLYFPMFEAIDAVWAEGKVPLWNPFCNFGLPMVADGTSSVFYPGKAIFAARFLSYPSRYGIYLSVHVLLAASSTYWLARKMRCQRPGATIAAIAFAFGAPVVFQATNVIYLVSAAWLPVAVLGVWCFLREPRIAWALLAAIACAMMILGGDPQMVYHVGLIAAVSVVCCGVSAGIGWAKRSPSSKQNFQKCGQQIVCLLLMVVTTTLMAAIQLWPTAKLAARSERAEQNHAVNLYSTFQQNEAGQQKSFNSLLTNSDVIVGQYQFSLPPWSLIEMIAPNVSGKPFPTNARWSDCLPAGDRMWYPSLYIGLLTLLLALGQVRFWGRNKISVWLTWILFVFLLGSFGWYGLMWLWHELDGVPMRADHWAAPVGGVYWLMSVLLPKYFAFRYPAKLFVVASLAFCLLAGRAVGRDHLLSRLKIKSAVTVAFAITAFGLFAVLGIPAIKLLPGDSVNATTMFGPFQVNEAIACIFFSLAHLLVLSGLIWWICRWGSSKQRQASSDAAIWCLVALTALDLLVANRWLLAEIPAAVYRKELLLETELASIGDADNQKSSRKLFASGYVPLEFESNVSQNRLVEIADWQRQTLQAKHHLNQRVRLVGSFHSIWPQAYQQFIEGYLADLKLAFWSDGNLGSESTFLLEEYGEEIETLYTINGECDDLRVTDVNLSVDSALHAGQMTLLVIENPDVTIESEFFDWNETRFQLLTHRSLAGGWLELPVLFDDGWQVRVRSVDPSSESDFGSVPVQASRRDLLQVHLPDQPRRYEVKLDYRPAWFWWAASVSMVSWMVVTGWMLVLFLLRRTAPSLTRRGAKTQPALKTDLL